MLNRTPTSHRRRAFWPRDDGHRLAGAGLVAESQLAEWRPRRRRSRRRRCEAGAWRGVIRQLHFPPRIKRVIYLYMAGGPSHLETFDYKPKLAEMHGQPMPESFTKGQPIAQLQGAKLTCFGPQHAFKKYGQSGQSKSATIFPQLGDVADEICIIRSMKTEAINHDPAHTFMNTGTHASPAGRRWARG